MYKYTPDPAGIKELGKSADICQAPAMAAATVVAARANAEDPDGNYKASPATVTAGWTNDLRAGAKVAETAPGKPGVLQRAVKPGA